MLDAAGFEGIEFCEPHEFVDEPAEVSVQTTAGDAAGSDALLIDTAQNGSAFYGPYYSSDHFNPVISISDSTTSNDLANDSVSFGFDEASDRDVSDAVAKALAELSLTGSDIPIRIPTLIEPLEPTDSVGVNLVASTNRINIDGFRSDSRFASFDGGSFATVIIDSGIDLDHPHFGPDSNGDGIADRIVYQASFVGTASADDDNGHGTHVAATVASSDSQYEGVAPGADIIALKTQNSRGSGSFAGVEQALKWVVSNAATYNIASVNMSLGDGSFITEAISQYGIGDEMAALAAMNIIVVSSSGNEYHSGNGNGVGYPSADPNSLSIGSERSGGGLSGFSQRDPELTTVFAPGDRVEAAWPGGGVRSLAGTSMASPHVAGVVLLAQEVAEDQLGRRLTFKEFEHLIRQTGPGRGLIPETGVDYPGVDMLALAESIVAMAESSSDLSISNLTVSAGPLRGDAGSATFTITNSGSTATPVSEVGLFVSRNEVVSFTGDLRLADAAVPSLGAGQSTNLTVPFTFPAANDPFWDFDSQYTIGLWVDSLSAIDELNELNNLSSTEGVDQVGVTINNLPQDLAGAGLTVLSSDDVWGGVVELEYTVSNSGGGPTPGSIIEFYISSDSTIDPATDYRIGTDSIAGVLGSGSIVDQVRLTLPGPGETFWTDGQTNYTIGYVVDATGLIAETNETNNRNQGVGLDTVSVLLNPPESSIFGSVYNDSDNDGVIHSRADHEFVVTHTFGGSIFPYVPSNYTLTNLPTFAGAARMTVQVRGHLGLANATLNVKLDSITYPLFAGVQPEGNAEIYATRTVELEGPAWDAAIADGVLQLQATTIAPGSFSSNNSNFIKITIAYVSADENLASGSYQAPLAVLRDIVTNVSIASMGTAVGDATLELSAIGYLGVANTGATVIIENELTLQWLGNVNSGDLLVSDSDSLVVDAATINGWLSDGELTATVQFGNGVVVQRLGAGFEFRLSYPIVSDAGVPGQVVELDIDGDGSVDRVTTTQADNPITPANESGNYVFVDVPQGNHRITVRPVDHAVATYPSSGQLDLTVVTGDPLLGYNFGVYFAPDVTPPRIDDVWVNSEQWGSALRQTFGDEPGYSLRGIHQSHSVPWRGGVDEITIQFSEDVGDSLAPEHLFLQGADGLNLARVDSIDYDPATYRLVIRPLASIQADRMLLTVFDTLTDAAGNRLDGEWTTGQESSSGDSNTLGDFHFRFNVLPGDVDNSGSVSFSGDLFTVFSNTGNDPADPSFRRYDIDGNGTISFSGDLFEVFQLTGGTLPATEPSIPTAPTAMDGSESTTATSNLNMFDEVFSTIGSREID
ncbi:S8 family serine peptidase [Stieleria varia]|uniref:S8 family serine peptidase n=1 Tax=Stieleria varia TaxID=2528005 RepID=UPI0011B44BE2|nr:S8 family serine peptidase [Stieleria varia]